MYFRHRILKENEMKLQAAHLPTTLPIATSSSDILTSSLPQLVQATDNQVVPTQKRACCNSNTSNNDLV